jgi:hypothetical protein
MFKRSAERIGNLNCNFELAVEREGRTVAAAGFGRQGSGIILFLR